MHITGLELKNFRNIEDLLLENISPGINVFMGKNAQGKTNLIEAVNYLSCGRSFRGVRDEEMIKYGAESAFIKCAFDAAYYGGKIDAALLRNSRRVVKINGMPIKRMSDMIGRINTVVFAPEDIRTIKDRPQQRRRLIDIEISKIKPSYYSCLQRYMSIIKNKNKLLKEEGGAEIIDVFNEQLADCAAEIVERRRQFIKKTAELAKKAQMDITGQNEELGIIYKCCAEGEDVRDEVYSRLKGILKKEMLFKTCLYGPHREDMELTVNGRSVRTCASQGQQRTAMIAFKLACARLGLEETLQEPVLLLDDVFSELDKGRRERLINEVKNFQVFVTVTDAVGLQHFTDINFYKVSAGTFFNM